MSVLKNNNQGVVVAVVLSPSDAVRGVTGRGG